MVKSSKTDLKSLQDIWYKKLKDSGFKDIEHADGTSKHAKPQSNKWLDPDQRQVVLDYYCMAYHFLNSHAFDSELHKVMWEYYSEGLSMRAIATAINSVFPKRRRISKDKVHRIINKYDKIMKGLYLST